MRAAPTPAGAGRPSPASGRPRRNRVRPDGELVATAERGTLWGNRGALLDVRGELARHARGRAWVCCLLEFHGWQRVQWQPGHLTELYFLDEVTALAAGHRPCGLCRHADHLRFKKAWAQAHGSVVPTAKEMDTQLHHDRLLGPGRRRRYEAVLADLPFGSVVEVEDRFWLVTEDALLAWSFGGYGERRDRTQLGLVDVITPRSTVAVLQAGYRPQIHPTAGVDAQDGRRPAG